MGTVAHQLGDVVGVDQEVLAVGDRALPVAAPVEARADESPRRPMVFAPPTPRLRWPVSRGRARRACRHPTTRRRGRCRCGCGTVHVVVSVRSLPAASVVSGCCMVIGSLLFGCGRASASPMRSRRRGRCQVSEPRRRTSRHLPRLAVRRVRRRPHHRPRRTPGRGAATTRRSFRARPVARRAAHGRDRAGRTSSPSRRACAGARRAGRASRRNGRGSSGPAAGRQ